MAEACYSAQGSTKSQVVAEITKLSFTKSIAGQYTHNAITTLAHRIERIMKGTYNPCNVGKEMSNLLLQNMYGPKSNKAVTLEAVLREAKETANKESKAMGANSAPAFTKRAKVADRCNIAAQAMICAKRRSN